MPSGRGRGRGKAPAEPKAKADPIGRPTKYYEKSIRERAYGTDQEEREQARLAQAALRTQARESGEAVDLGADAEYWRRVAQSKAKSLPFSGCKGKGSKGAVAKGGQVTPPRTDGHVNGTAQQAKVELSPRWPPSAWQSHASAWDAWETMGSDVWREQDWNSASQTPRAEDKTLWTSPASLVEEQCSSAANLLAARVAAPPSPREVSSVTCLFSLDLGEPDLLSMLGDGFPSLREVHLTAHSVSCELLWKLCEVTWRKKPRPPLRICFSSGDLADKGKVFKMAQQRGLKIASEIGGVDEYPMPPADGSAWDVDLVLLPSTPGLASGLFQ
uniref:Uncharacterized protein n=1 Tax=Noctiluca scintillans TaxID=2966 RepID=A0A7S1AD11_NOCSC|mmetsp:Transcript_4135/g.11655  ORF Transcript_4135/g.11655 Transcript_4135/m.11655 type:complete len:329 (+) Transcript_4135:46-1032(+)